MKNILKICFVVLLLCGCSTNSNLQVLEEEYDNLLKEYNALTKEYEHLKVDYMDLQTDNETIDQKTDTIDNSKDSTSQVTDSPYTINQYIGYQQQKLIGTWQINEHQTITFNNDGTGYIWDDGIGTLTEEDGENTYNLTYEWWKDGRITMMFPMNFTCELGATFLYPITFYEDKLVFHQNYIMKEENDIVCTNVK